jgi:hypothetical protein
MKQYNLEPEDDKAPDSIRKALTAEIDTIRSTMEVVNLYVSNFFGAAGAVFINDKKDNNNNNNNSNVVS